MDDSASFCVTRSSARSGSIVGSSSAERLPMKCGSLFIPGKVGSEGAIVAADLIGRAF